MRPRPGFSNVVTDLDHRTQTWRTSVRHAKERWTAYHRIGTADASPDRARKMAAILEEIESHGPRADAAWESLCELVTRVERLLFVFRHALWILIVLVVITELVVIGRVTQLW